jgi:hypothetical protein
MVWDRRAVAVQQAASDHLIRVVRERSETGQRPEHHHRKRVDVDLEVERRVQVDLWRHKLAVPQRIDSQNVASLDELRQAEVRGVRLARVVQQGIRGLEISVNDTVLVHERHP